MRRDTIIPTALVAGSTCALIESAAAQILGPGNVVHAFIGLDTAITLEGQKILSLNTQAETQAEPITALNTRVVNNASSIVSWAASIAANDTGAVDDTQGSITLSAAIGTRF